MRITSLIGAIVVSFWLASAAAAENKAIIPADAPGHVEYVKLKYSVQRKAMIEAYDTIGVRDPKWNEVVHKLLEGMSLFLANNGESRNATIDPAPDIETLLGWANEAIDAGCTDPQVLYLRGFILTNMGDPQKAAPDLQRAAVLIKDVPYSAYRKLWIYWRGWNLARQIKDAKLTQEYREAILDSAVEALRDDGWTDLEQRVVGVMIAQNFVNERTLRGALIERLEKLDWPVPLPRRAWAAHYAIGKIQSQLGWDAGGYDFEVPAGGWEELGRLMPGAQKALNTAEKLCPEFPEAPATLVTIALADGNISAAYDCFNRAVANEIDCETAYGHLFAALYPQWGGDDRKALDVGIAALETGRFDTSAPWTCISVMHSIARFGDSTDALKSEYSTMFMKYPDALPALRKTLDGYSAVPKHEDLYTYYDGIRLATAAHANDWEYTRELFSKIKIDDGTRRGAATWCLPVSRIKALSAMFAATDSSELIDAHVAIGEGKLEIAKAFYESRLTRADGDSGLDQYFRNQLWMIDALTRFKQEKPEWANLQPTAAADGTPVGWWPVLGDWKVNPDGTLIATPDDEGYCVLLFTDPPQSGFSISAEMHLAGDAKRGSDLCFGISPNWTALHQRDEILFIPLLNMVGIRSEDSSIPPEAVEEGLDGGVLLLNVKNNRAQVFFNDKQRWVNESVPVAHEAPWQSKGIAIVAYGLKPGHQVRVTGLKLMPESAPTHPKEDDVNIIP